MIPLPEFFFYAYPVPGYRYVLFLRRSLDGKHLMCFQSETSVFKLLRRSVACERRRISGGDNRQLQIHLLSQAWRTMDGKHLIRFQSETSVLKFPRPSVDSVRLN